MVKGHLASTSPFIFRKINSKDGPNKRNGPISCLFLLVGDFYSFHSTPFIPPRGHTRINCDTFHQESQQQIGEKRN